MLALIVFLLVAIVRLCDALTAFRWSFLLHRHSHNAIFLFNGCECVNTASHASSCMTWLCWWWLVSLWCMNLWRFYVSVTLFLENFSNKSFVVVAFYHFKIYSNLFDCWAFLYFFVGFVCVHLQKTVLSECCFWQLAKICVTSMMIDIELSKFNQQRGNAMSNSLSKLSTWSTPDKKVNRKCDSVLV